MNIRIYERNTGEGWSGVDRELSVVRWLDIPPVEWIERRRGVKIRIYAQRAIGGWLILEKEMSDVRWFDIPNTAITELITKAEELSAQAKGDHQAIAYDRAA